MNNVIIDDVGVIGSTVFRDTLCLRPDNVYACGSGELACLEESTFGRAWLCPDDFRRTGQSLSKNSYGQKLLALTEELQ
ncbi:hypothetical protein [Pseudomonas urmiensis]|uniref:hypothetical protein n=1 Tax=Pseudomonas urmiensis TaxID=2745493 RepID=UPI003CC3AC0A